MLPRRSMPGSTLAAKEWLRTRGLKAYRSGAGQESSPEEETPSSLDALPDEVLLVMLDKAASGEYNDACDSVTKWCGMDKRRNGLCRAAGQRQWDEMTTRIFGPNAPTLVANDPMKNFFALCKSEYVERRKARVQAYAERFAIEVFEEPLSSFDPDNWTEDSEYDYDVTDEHLAMCIGIVQLMPLHG